MHIVPKYIICIYIDGYIFICVYFNAYICRFTKNSNNSIKTNEYYSSSIYNVILNDECVAILIFY